MTNDEAKAIIRKEYLCFGRDCDIERSCGKCDLMIPSKEPILEAYKMAMQALEQEPYDDAKYHEEHGEVIVDKAVWEDAKRALEQEPKTGHWIRELIRNEKGGCIGAKMICSRCNNDNKHDEYMNYCPNCGARMVDPQESEDKE